MRSSIKHVYFSANLAAHVVVGRKHLRNCLLSGLLLLGSQHQSRLWGHPQVLCVSEVLGVVLIDVVRQLSAEDQDRACSLVALLHVRHQFRRFINPHIRFVLPAPLFYVVLEAADALESARCLVGLAQCEDALEFGVVSHPRNVISLTEPAVKQIIEILLSPSLFRIWLVGSPAPRIDIEMVKALSPPVGVELAWPED